MILFYRTNYHKYLVQGYNDRTNYHKYLVEGYNDDIIIALKFQNTEVITLQFVNHQNYSRFNQLEEF